MGGTLCLLNWGGGPGYGDVAAVVIGCIDSARDGRGHAQMEREQELARELADKLGDVFKQPAGGTLGSAEEGRSKFSRAGWGGRDCRAFTRIGGEHTLRSSVMKCVQCRGGWIRTRYFGLCRLLLVLLSFVSGWPPSTHASAYEYYVKLTIRPDLTRL
ncbi:hypothetical protein L249_8847 [Ophiocordyceps polyrhachis-furcata BCC 54312]|uniref:Uncharacterized protein n=1 Tax=Ophiocordyceps polyrhachis-furcata BCC 54312 TaxID=1330021 RepID=A0A367L230_9HYPO|nr:hypothetical protein L249_8847 [Ophiocordyceps polyrhachis-furcata BCC 54312]